MENTTPQRTLPFNLQAEQMLLGAILINPDLQNQVSDFLREDHFYEKIHQAIYNAIEIVSEKGLTISTITMMSMLDGKPLFLEVGGQQYLTKITAMAMAVINPIDYGNIIYDLAIKRNLIAIGHEVVNEAYDSTLQHSAFEQLEKAEAKLFNLAVSGVHERSFLPMKDTIASSLLKIDRAIKNSDKVIGTSTGLVDLDSKLSGFQNSDLVILAGRPSMGKTAFAINFAYNACKHYLAKAKEEGEQTPKSVGFFSLEMSSEQLANRLLSMATKIDSAQLRTGKLNEEHYTKLKQAANDLAEVPFFIDDTPALSISAIRTRARRLKRKHNLGILFIDYLQLIHSAEKVESRVLEVSKITQSLKAIAKELDIPIIALSQLSRGVEQREDKRPMLSDLRESGSIEQDADLVMFVYREEYYMVRTQPKHGSEQYDKWQKDLDKVHNVAEIIIAKHRNGAVGKIELSYLNQFSKIDNLKKEVEYSKSQFENA